VAMKHKRGDLNRSAINSLKQKSRDTSIESLELLLNLNMQSGRNNMAAEDPSFVKIESNKDS
jgi:hypothetical protein